MAGKIVEIATPGTRLSIAHRQLVIDRPHHPPATIPVEDLGVVIVDDGRASYTQSVFVELMAAGSTVLVTGRNHLPVGMMLPISVHHAPTERHHRQVAVTTPARKRLWQQLVRRKIEMQGLVLNAYTDSDGGLAPLAARVKSGDPDNLEAQAAQRYWPRLFGAEFRRRPNADLTPAGENALLNYGYAIVRAACARSIVASGLLPSLGLFHTNRSNPFCLADDLMEPWRPIVDWRVKQLTIGASSPPSLDVRTDRAALLSLLNETVLCGDVQTSMALGIELSAQSLARCLTLADRRLALPAGLPMTDDSVSNGDG